MKLREIFAEAVSKLRENEIINPERDARASYPLALVSQLIA